MSFLNRFFIILSLSASANAAAHFQAKTGPLGTGEQVYFELNESGELLLNVVQSLKTNGYCLARSIERCKSYLFYQRGCYQIKDWQLFVMLTIISDYQYRWWTSSAGFLTDAWWINFVNIEMVGFSSQKLAAKLKKMGIKSIELVYPGYEKLKLDFDDKETGNLLISLLEELDRQGIGLRIQPFAHAESSALLHRQ